MNFTSDNASGIAPEIMAAIARANEGAAASYGDDEITKRLTHRFSEIFEHEVAVFPVVTGTAANALALAAFTPPHGAVLCHAHAHLNVDECGAPEMFTAGAKLLSVKGAMGKMTPQTLHDALGHLFPGLVHHIQAATLSLTQATEMGTVYRLDEIAELAAVAHDGPGRHMDGRVLPMRLSRSAGRPPRSLEGGRRCAVLRSDEERSAGGGGGRLFRSGARRRFHFPPQAERASRLENAVSLGAARSLSR